MINAAYFPPQPPRNPSDYVKKGNLDFGLRRFRVWAVFFLCCMALNVIAAILARQQADIMIFFLVLCIPLLIVSAGSYFFAKAKMKTRLLFIREGFLVKCLVPQQAGAPITQKSKQNRTLQLQYEFEGRQQVHVMKVNAVIYRFLPRDRHFYALMIPGRKEFLFPHELNLAFLPEPEKKRINHSRV